MENYEYDISYEVEEELIEPKKYKVILLNDDFSTMEFVINVLNTVFRKSATEAESLMLTVHTKGEAVCGIYTKEIAFTKVAQVKSMAREAKFPLKAIAKEE